MKCRLDGPPPTDVAQHIRTQSGTQVAPSSFCMRVQKAYIHLFGSAKGGCRQEMPRRVLRTEPRPGLPSLKRKRDEQMHACTQQPADLSPEAAAELVALEQKVAKEAKKRATDNQENFAKRLDNYAIKQRKNLLADGQSTSSATALKLKNHLAEAETELARVRNLEKRTLATALQKPPLPFGTFVVATKDDHKESLNDLGADFRLWPTHGPDCVQLCSELLKAPMPPVWLCSTEKEEAEIMFTPGHSSTFSAVAVLVGGHVATTEWTTVALQQKKLLPGLCSLVRALSRPRELFFHPSLSGGTEPCAKALSIALGAARSSPAILSWKVVAKWKHMPLDCT